MVMDAKTAARMRQPMSRGEVHALMAKSLNEILEAMNVLEGRIVALEQSKEPERTPSGLVIPR